MMVITMAKPRGPISFFPKISFQVCNPDIYGVFFCGRGDLVTCGDLDENSGPHCSGCSLKNCVSCIDTRIHLDHLTGKILKIQWVSFPSNNRTSAVKTQDGLRVSYCQCHQSVLIEIHGIGVVFVQLPSNIISP